MNGESAKNRKVLLPLSKGRLEVIQSRGKWSEINPAVQKTNKEASMWHRRCLWRFGTLKLVLNPLFFQAIFSVHLTLMTTVSQRERLYVVWEKNWSAGGVRAWGGVGWEKTFSQGFLWVYGPCLIDISIALLSGSYPFCFLGGGRDKSHRLHVFLGSWSHSQRCASISSARVPCQTHPHRCVGVFGRGL